MAVSRIDLEARQFSLLKIVATLQAAHALGLRAHDVLAGSGLTQAQVMDPATQMSMSQYLRVTDNFVRLSQRADAALMVGKYLHVSSYGMFGYAMLCQPTLRKAFALAVQYHRLAAPVIPLRWEDRAQVAVWSLPLWGQPTYVPLSPAQFDYFLELQCMILAMATEDIMGPGCRYQRIKLACPRPVHAKAMEDALGCTVEFNAGVNELHMPQQWMDQTPKLSNPVTAAQMSDACAGLLRRLQLDTSVAQRVYHALTRVPGVYPGMEDVALSLGMTSRTLRRKLLSENTSFQVLLAQVREALARDYLIATDLSVDDIAATLGFSDAMAFRHAFKRWTGMTPLDFRSRASAKTA